MILNELLTMLQQPGVKPTSEVTIYGDGTLVHVQIGDEIFISSQRPVGVCPKCLSTVVESLNKEYVGYCFKCDEDKYSFEL